MTTEELALSSVKAEVMERGAQPETAKVVACGFCRRRLADEYFFTCRRCDASYCYIHMSRHQSIRCAQRSGKLYREGRQDPPCQREPGHTTPSVFVRQPPKKTSLTVTFPDGTMMVM
jgi:hypothetical protein